MLQRLPRLHRPSSHAAFADAEAEAAGGRVQSIIHCDTHGGKTCSKPGVDDSTGFQALGQLAPFNAYQCRHQSLKCTSVGKKIAGMGLVCGEAAIAQTAQSISVVARGFCACFSGDATPVGSSDTNAGAERELRYRAWIDLTFFLIQWIGPWGPDMIRVWGSGMSFEMGTDDIGFNSSRHETDSDRVARFK